MKTIQKFISQRIIFDIDVQKHLLGRYRALFQSYISRMDLK